MVLTGIVANGRNRRRVVALKVSLMNEFHSKVASEKKLSSMPVKRRIETDRRSTNGIESLVGG